MEEEKKKKNRSLNQNSYYWGIVVCALAEDWGYPPEEHDLVHEILKCKFLKKNVKVKGIELEAIGSTAGLKTGEFEELMSQIRRWASMEFKCYIPLPNETPYNYLDNETQKMQKLRPVQK